jgi:hypothetical protein
MRIEKSIGTHERKVKNKKGKCYELSKERLRCSALIGFPDSGKARTPWNDLPILDQDLKLIQESVDLLEIFAASFLRFQIQGPAKGDHVPEITKLRGRRVRIFSLLEDDIPECGQLSLDPSGVNLDRFSISLANEFELFGERFHRRNFKRLGHSNEQRRNCRGSEAKCHAKPARGNEEKKGLDHASDRQEPRAGEDSPTGRDLMQIGAC